MPSPVIPQVYLDTSVWLTSILNQESHVECDRLILAASRGRISLTASWLVRAEIQTSAVPSVDSKVRAAVDTLLDSGIRWVMLDRFIAEDAVRISRSLPKRLQGADAVHLATAIRTDCDYLMTLDHGFPNGLVEGVQVCQPKVVWQEDIFDT